MRERLARIEQNLLNLTNYRGEMRQAIDELTMEIREQFEGHDGRPGIVTRIALLEQSEARRARAFWIAFGASITALLTAIWTKLGGR